jgi:mRNA interferase RelE/StbE
MDEYQIVFARSARKELEALSARVGERVLRRIEALSRAPRPRGCRKLRGSDNLWRLRVGDHRVVYGIDDARRLVDVIAIRHRRDAYR